MVDEATPIYTPPPPSTLHRKVWGKRSKRFVPNELRESLRSRERISKIPRT